MSNFKFNVKIVECVVLLVLLLSLPLNSSSLSGGSLDSGQSGPSDSSQQLFRQMEERFGSDQVINTVLNINDSNTDGILNNFNVSKDEILRRISALQPENDSSRPIFGERIFESETFASPTNEPVKNDAEKQEIYIDAFKKRIESMVERNASRHTSDWSTAAIHDMAFYPLCSKNNQTSWLEENTAKLYFSSSIFDKLIPNTFLHRAILRLRQKIPEKMADSDANATGEPDSQNGCSDVDEIIHVKVSIFIKRPVRGEPKPVVKKLVCHSFTLNRLNNEWVEIDVRQVIKYWEKMYRASLIHNKGGTVADPMVAIDVEDEYEQPLKAGLFFEPTDCQASAPAIPWSLYGENVRSLLGAQILPHNPRLDIKWSQLHRPHRHYGHRSHRLHNSNHLDNLRLLNESRLMLSPTDHSDLNLVSMENNRNHQKSHNIGAGSNDSYRVKRSLNSSKRTKRKLSA